MTSLRWDETWHRLREWTNASAPSERLAAQILLHEGFTELDPSHALGGKDGGKDAVCCKNARSFAMAVYFPRGQQPFRVIQTKFKNDLRGAKQNALEGLIFVTNQELRSAERRKLESLWSEAVEIYHLDRITTLLDAPALSSVRRQFLGIDFAADGTGGPGGDAEILGNRGIAVAGRGGPGGSNGRGGAGGKAAIVGDDGIAFGGDGGGAGHADGRGGRPAASVAERAGDPTSWWHIGRGGAGSNAPEYDRRLSLLARVRREYMEKFPDTVPFVDAGVDPVPVGWVNKRLEELGEPWRIEAGPDGYILPPLNALIRAPA